jgi:hypothetical protein
MFKRMAAASAMIALALIGGGCFLNSTHYQAKDGSTVYVGKVVNDGPPLSDPIVEGTFFDANDTVITKASGPACRVMPTKFAAAFKVTLPPGTAPAARVEWKLTGTTVDNPYLATDLTAQLFGTGPPLIGSDKPQFFGEITNNSANTYLRGHVCAAWMNAAGEVVRVASTEASGLRFNPGDVLPFALSEDVPQEATQVEFFLDAGVTTPGSPPFTFVRLPPSAFQHATQRSGPLPGGGGTGFLGIGEVRNAGSTPIIVVVGAVTRGADGHPNGVSAGNDFCGVPAYAGGFTYGSYVLTTAQSPAPPLELNIDGEAFPAEFELPLTPTNVAKVGGATLGQRVTGTVKNTTGKTLRLINACAGVYDAAGNVVGAFPVRPTMPAGGLAPNASVTFSVDVPTFGTAKTVKAIAAGIP